MSAEFYEHEKSSDELQMTSRQALKRLLPLLRTNRKALLFCLVLLVGSTGLGLYWPLLLRKALDVNIAGDDFHGLLWTVATIGLIQIGTIVLQYVMRVKLETVGQDIMLSLKQRLFDHILSLDISYFDQNPVGRLMARVETDTEALRMLFTNTVVLIIGDILLVAGIYGILFYTNWKLALAWFLYVPVIAIMVYVFHKRTTPRFFEVRRKMAEVTATLTEFLQGMSIVQIFHRGAYARRKVYGACQAKFKDDAYVQVAVCIFFNTVLFFEYVKIGLVLLLGTYLGITFGTVMMFVIYIYRSFEPIYRSSEQLSTFQKAIAGSKRIFALLDRQPKLVRAAEPVVWPELKQSIKFENVSFSYNDDGVYALKNATFEIPVGRRIALVGVTGGGKSTVIALLLRYYDPQEGRITVDGIDIRDIDLSELRKRFALVLQDIILFPGNIASNISLDAESIERERLIEAAQTVEADRFIARLPNGYDTIVSEKGSNFSRGERQLLSFARALAFEPDLLILDEATSSVDPETERTIQHSLKKLMEGRTSLIIAHRLSTILDVDQILVIRKGEIIERGTHTELILQHGYYSKLFHLQFKQKNGVLSNVG
ncbi:MAG TPA: ABC transporter ATP-binding protein [candidate division Zixibacteria bacterium]|nr:ABC transporter ATP-binding protein [candidate division Zixibacteria bacterium]